jgi:hypothetical protein
VEEYTDLKHFAEQNGRWVMNSIQLWLSLSNFILSTDKLNKIDNMIKKLFLGKTIDT